MSYALIGKRVKVHLYDRQGIAIGAIEGTVSDFSPRVMVSLKNEMVDGKVKSTAMYKDLVLVTGIKDFQSPHLPPDSPGEGWFAVQDLVVLDEGPALSTN